MDQASLPFSIKKIARDLHKDFLRYLEINDLDEQLKKNVGIMFEAEQSKVNLLEFELEQR